VPLALEFAFPISKSKKEVQEENERTLCMQKHNTKGKRKNRAKENHSFVSLVKFPLNPFGKSVYGKTLRIKKSFRR